MSEHTSNTQNTEQTAEEFNSIPEVQVCARWRLSGGKLPLAHRHIKALTQRHVGASLYAWVQSRAEQLLSGEHPVKHPNGMMLVRIDPDGEILLTIEPLPEAPAKEDTALKVASTGEIVDAGDASVWIRSGSEIATPPSPPAAPRGTRSLVYDLAKTMNYEVLEAPLTQDQLEAADEAFLVSDLFGVILLDDRGGEFSAKIADALAKFWSIA